MTHGITRRTAVGRLAAGGLAAGLAGGLLPGTAGAARGRRVVAGTYAAEGGEGLYRLGHDAATGRWTLAPPVAAIRNASFAVRDGQGRWYALDESDGGRVTAYGPGWRDRDLAALAQGNVLRVMERVEAVAAAAAGRPPVDAIDRASR